MTLEPFAIGGIQVPPGERKDIRVRVSESVTMTPVFIPVTVFHGARPGASVFVTAAIHGDELNGIEMVRQVRATLDPKRMAGTVVLVSLANPLGFVAGSRETPDGRDLNRMFPGAPRGSLGSQIADVIFRKVVLACEHGIDLHTAARGRMNIPQVRADMHNRRVQRLATAFGCEVILDQPGDPGMLRREAVKRGIPTIVYEAGEPMKFEPAWVEEGVRGIRNVLADLKILDPSGRKPPPMMLILKERRWLRARRGGILVVKVKPGHVVEKGEEIAYHTKPFGQEVEVVKAPFTGLVVGVATSPVAYPGTAVCHLVRLQPLQAKMWKRLVERKDGAR